MDWSISPILTLLLTLVTTVAVFVALRERVANNEQKLNALQSDFEEHKKEVTAKHNATDVIVSLLRQQQTHIVAALNEIKGMLKGK